MVIGGTSATASIRLRSVWRPLSGGRLGSVSFQAAMASSHLTNCEVLGLRHAEDQRCSEPKQSQAIWRQLL